MERHQAREDAPLMVGQVGVAGGEPPRDGW
jgi:hypothetical protein